MRRPSTRRALVVGAVLVAALAIRVWDVQTQPYHLINDAPVYLRLGDEIASLGSYSSRDPGAGGTRGPSAYFPPAYPYFLAAVDLIDGHRTRSSAAIHGARASQAVLGTLTVGLVGLVALEAFGPLIAMVAMALAAVYPVMVELSGTVVAEGLMAPLVLAAVWAALRARRARPPYPWVAASGALTGLAALAHENAILILLALIPAVSTARPWRSRRAFLVPALLVATAALVIAPWTVRNAVVMHRFIPISDETGVTLVGTYNKASAVNRTVPYKWRIFYGIPQDARLVRQAPRLTEAELGDRLQHQALSYIAHHPLSPVVVTFHNTLRLLELEGSYAWRASALAGGLDPGQAQVGVTSFWLLCILALAGLATPVARRAPRWLWAVPLLLALSVVLVNVETPRFRAPVDPFLVLLAACAVGSAVARLRGTPVGRDARARVSPGDAELVEVIESSP